MSNCSKNCKFTKICILLHPFWLQRMISYHGHRTEIYQDLLNFKLAQNTMMCIWTAHFLVYYVTGTAVGACSRLHMDRVPWKACFGSNIYFVDCTSTGFFRSVRSLFFSSYSVLLPCRWQCTVCCMSYFFVKTNILVIPPFDSSSFKKWGHCSLSASSVTYLGGDGVGSMLACSRLRAGDCFSQSGRQAKSL